jgi:anaerobic magnesium-protoporphyrin IX monomethyl ester cyclase
MFSHYQHIIQLHTKNNLEAFILNLGDASKVSAIILHNFNAIKLAGLREMMVAQNYRGIDNYEKIWKKNQNFSTDKPSTLYKNKNYIPQKGLRRNPQGPPARRYKNTMDKLN